MKQLLVLLVAIIAPPLVLAGGISSGGGGTLPANPVNTRDISNIISKAKRDLRLLTFAQVRTYREPNFSYEEKIFGRELKITDVLETTGIEILMDEPCRDANGVAVDGSIHASKPDTICISAFTTAPKLIKERAFKEIYALILHELSHLLGTDEKEADMYQRDILFSLENMAPTFGKDMLESSLERPNGLAKEIDSLLAGLDHTDPLARKELMLQINYGGGTLLDHLAQWEMSVFLPPQYDYYSFQVTKSHLIASYLIAKSGANDASYWQKKYDDIFQGRDEVSLREYFEARGGVILLPEHAAHLTLHRIQNDDDVKAQLNELSSYFSDLHIYLYNFVSNLPLTAMLPPEPNPWESFRGLYDVVNVQCEFDGWEIHDGRFTAFEIFAPEYDEAGRLYIRNHYENGYSDQGLHRDAPAVDASSRSIVSGNDVSAKLVTEAGDLWGDRWSKREQELVKTKEGYTMTVESRYQRRSGSTISNTGSASCEFELELK